MSQEAPPSVEASRGLSPNDPGRLLHRFAFSVISLLPGIMRKASLRRIFNIFFALSDDPWSYRSSEYEGRKRAHLIAAIPAEVRSLVEVGCADGHNLLALAQERSDMTLIGLEVSSAAAAIASQHASEVSNVHILGPKDTTKLTAISSGGLDCVVLSEVLYYMGSSHTMRKSLFTVQEAMLPGCHVIMVHGSVDAAVLHRRAISAMSLIVEQEFYVDDAHRPFVITVARNGSFSAPSNFENFRLRVASSA